MARRFALLLVLFALAACSGSDDPATPAVWTAESLHSGLQISFPPDYEGDGAYCGMDACWFAKNRTDGNVSFHISVLGMTGGLPEHFDALPLQFKYPARVLMTTDSGLSGALYYEPADVFSSETRHATFVVEDRAGGGWIEAVRMTYGNRDLAQVKAILGGIAYAP